MGPQHFMTTLSNFFESCEGWNALKWTKKSLKGTFTRILGRIEIRTNHKWRQDCRTILEHRNSSRLPWNFCNYMLSRQKQMYIYSYIKYNGCHTVSYSIKCICLIDILPLIEYYAVKFRYFEPPRETKFSIGAIRGKITVCNWAQ